MRIASGDVLVVMDADLSHPPEAIPPTCGRIDQWRLGRRRRQSIRRWWRYTEKGWGVFRWLNSRLATLIKHAFDFGAE